MHLIVTATKRQSCVIKSTINSRLDVLSATTCRLAEGESQAICKVITIYFVDRRKDDINETKGVVSDGSTVRGRVDRM